MDIFILVGGFTIVCLMGMPVAYALGIAAIAAALYAGIPLEAVMGGAETMYPEYMMKLRQLPAPPKSAPK